MASQQFKEVASEAAPSSAEAGKHIPDRKKTTKLSKQKTTKNNMKKGTAGINEAEGYELSDYQLPSIKV